MQIPPLYQCLWFLSKPWPHLGGLRELLLRAAFCFHGGKRMEGCAAAGVIASMDLPALAARLDAAEATLLGGEATSDPLAAPLIAFASRDARWRAGERWSGEDRPQHIEVVSVAEPTGTGLVLLPGLSFQQAVAAAVEAGETRLIARGPWSAPALQLPETEASQMVRHHPDLYAVTSAGIQMIPGSGGRVSLHSINQAVGFGYSQKIETHRRRGFGRLRGR